MQSAHVQKAYDNMVEAHFNMIFAKYTPSIRGCTTQDEYDSIESIFRGKWETEFGTRALNYKYQVAKENYTKWKHAQKMVDIDNVISMHPDSS